MTTSATPSDSAPRLWLPDPGRLLAALPGLLGFPPQHSLLLLCIESGGTVDAIVRADIGPDAVAEAADALGRLCRCPAATAIVIVVDERLAQQPAVQRKLVAAMHDRLGRRGIDLAAAFGVAVVASGASWRALLGPPAAGVVADPRDCPVAASRVLNGQVLHASRAELVAQLERDEPRCAALAAELAGGGAPRRMRAADTLEQVLGLIRTGSTGTPVTVAELAAVARALTLPAVRDALCALAVGELADAAEWFWLEAVRTFPNPLRARPATLLGFSAYARGSGPLAGIAFGLAIDADPGYRLARMLDRAMQQGMRPDAIRGLAGAGYTVAARLGVVLPPRVPTLPSVV